MTSITCLNGDCLEVMGGMDDNSVDLILTDPPYFKVKTEWWDNQWEKPENFLYWLDSIFEQIQRLLKSNGSLYCFASPQMSARVEILVGGRFNVLNSIRWVKDQGWYKKQNRDEQRCFVPQTESIIFAEHYGADNTAKGEAGYGAKCDELRGFVFEPLRSYLDGERKAANIDKADCNAACGFSRTPGGMASRHYFSQSQWCLPTKEHYTALQSLFNSNGGEFLRREYEFLRREYEDLRRPFSVSPDVPYTDVWEFVTVQSYAGKHPCEKPEEMIAHMIQCSTNPGAMVLDPFGGGGSTAATCQKLGRSCISIEIDEKFHEMSQSRVAAPDMFAEVSVCV